MDLIIEKNKEIEKCREECELLENEIKNKRVLLRQTRQNMEKHQKELQDLIKKENEPEPVEEPMDETAE